MADTSANLGARDLPALCVAQANACRSGDIGDAGSALELIDRVFHRVQPAVSALIDAS